MSTKLFLTKLSWVFFILFISSILVSSGVADNSMQCKWSAVDQNKCPEILTMINSRIEENYDRIKTWQGKVNIVFDNVNTGEKVKRLYEQILVDKPLPNEIIDHVELNREFAVDANEGLLYEGIYPDAQQNIIDAQTGRNLRLNELVQIGIEKNILTPNYLLNSTEKKNREGIIARRIVTKQARPKGDLTCQSSLPPVFDPRDTMRIFGDSTRNTFAPLGGTFAQYMAFFDKKEGHSVDGYPTIVVEECDIGKVKKYKIALLFLSKDIAGATLHLFYNLVCSSEAGFNVVSFSIADEKDRVYEHRTWEYGLFDGVYLPKTIIQQRFNRESGKLDNEKRYAFKDQKVNKPVPSETFTYKNLDLKNGDRFIDRIENKEYKYQDENLAFIKDINNTPKEHRLK